MRMMNEAIENARDAQDFLEKIVNHEKNLKHQLEQCHQGNDIQYVITSDRQPGENRAAHRARLKRERRVVSSAKVRA